MKKLLSVAAAAALLFGAAACSAQSSVDYPVSVASYTFNAKPATVVCLSDSIADIIITSVNQETLKKLASDGICVMNMISAQNGEQLETLYSSVAAVMGGNTSGRENGSSKAKSLLTTMSDLQRVVPEKDVLPVACYLYDEKYTPAPATTFCGKLFEYAGSVNAFAQLPSNPNIEGTNNKSYYVDCLKLGDASYIFCDKGLKDKLMEDPELSTITAVRNGDIYEIDANVFERQGSTVTDTLSYMIETMYPELAPESSTEESSKKEESKPDESSKKEESKPEESSKEESKPEESSAEEIKVEADNSLEITEDLHFEKGTLYDEFDKVQKRLADLGFYNPDDGFTGFFGDKSEAAYKAFQKANGLKADGNVTTEGLILLFSADVKPAAAQSTDAE